MAPHARARKPRHTSHHIRATRARTVRHEEARPGRQLVEHEQFVVSADAAVVHLGLALHLFLPQGHQLLVGERDAVHALTRAGGRAGGWWGRAAVRIGDTHGHTPAHVQRTDNIPDSRPHQQRGAPARARASHCTNVREDEAQGGTTDPPSERTTVNKKR
jgi:hypothetical protein